MLRLVEFIASSMPLTGQLMSQIATYSVTVDAGADAAIHNPNKYTNVGVQAAASPLGFPSSSSTTPPLPPPPPLTLYLAIDPVALRLFDEPLADMLTLMTSSSTSSAFQSSFFPPHNHHHHNHHHQVSSSSSSSRIRNHYDGGAIMNTPIISSISPTVALQQVALQFHIAVLQWLELQADAVEAAGIPFYDHTCTTRLLMRRGFAKFIANVVVRPSSLNDISSWKGERIPPLPPITAATAVPSTTSSTSFSHHFHLADSHPFPPPLPPPFHTAFTSSSSLHASPLLSSLSSSRWRRFTCSVEGFVVDYTVTPHATLSALLNSDHALTSNGGVSITTAARGPATAGNGSKSKPSCPSSSSGAAIAASAAGVCDHIRVMPSLVVLRVLMDDDDGALSTSSPSMAGTLIIADWSFAFEFVDPMTPASSSSSVCSSTAPSSSAPVFGFDSNSNNNNTDTDDGDIMNNNANNSDGNNPNRPLQLVPGNQLCDRFVAMGAIVSCAGYFSSAVADGSGGSADVYEEGGASTTTAAFRMLPPQAIAAARSIFCSSSASGGSNMHGFAASSLEIPMRRFIVMSVGHPLLHLHNQRRVATMRRSPLLPSPSLVAPSSLAAISGDSRSRNANPHPYHNNGNHSNSHSHPNRVFEGIVEQWLSFIVGIDGEAEVMGRDDDGKYAGSDGEAMMTRVMMTPSERLALRYLVAESNALHVFVAAFVALLSSSIVVDVDVGVLPTATSASAAPSSPTPLLSSRPSLFLGDELHHFFHEQNQSMAALSCAILLPCATAEAVLTRAIADGCAANGICCKIPSPPHPMTTTAAVAAATATSSSSSLSSSPSSANNNGSQSLVVGASSTTLCNIPLLHSSNNATKSVGRGTSSGKYFIKQHQHQPPPSPYYGGTRGLVGPNSSLPPMGPPRLPPVAPPPPISSRDSPLVAAASSSRRIIEYFSSGTFTTGPQYCTVVPNLRCMPAAVVGAIGKQLSQLRMGGGGSVMSGGGGSSSSAAAVCIPLRGATAAGAATAGGGKASSSSGVVTTTYTSASSSASASQRIAASVANSIARQQSVSASAAAPPSLADDASTSSGNTRNMNDGFSCSTIFSSSSSCTAAAGITSSTSSCGIAGSHAAIAASLAVPLPSNNTSSVFLFSPPPSPSSSSSPPHSSSSSSVFDALKKKMPVEHNALFKQCDLTLHLDETTTTTNNTTSRDALTQIDLLRCAILLRAARCGGSGDKSSHQHRHRFRSSSLSQSAIQMLELFFFVAKSTTTTSNQRNNSSANETMMTTSVVGDDLMVSLLRVAIAASTFRNTAITRVDVDNDDGSNNSSSNDNDIIDATIAIAIMDKCIASKTGASILSVSLFEECLKPGFAFIDFYAAIVSHLNQRLQQ